MLVHQRVAMVLPKFPPLGRLIWTLEPAGLKARLEDCLATGQLVDSGKGVTAPLPSNGNGSLGRQEEQLQVKRKHKGAMAVRSCQGVLQDSDDSACYTSSLCRFEAMDSTCQVECLSDRDLPDSPRSCVYSIRTGVPQCRVKVRFQALSYSFQYFPCDDQPEGWIQLATLATMCHQQCAWAR